MYYENQYIITYLATVGGIDNSQTTGIKLQSVAGILTDRPGILILDYADPLDETRCEWVSYTSIDVNQELVGAVRGVEKGSAKIHSQNAVIAFPHSKSNNNQFADIFHPVATTSLAEDILLKETAAAPTTPSAGYKKLYFDTDDKIYAVDDAGAAKALATELYADGAAKNNLYSNLLINGNMDVSQRAATFVSGANNDDVYTLDRWNLLSDGNDTFDVSQDAVTDLAGSNYAIKLDVETSKRGGIIQFIESKDAIKFRGQTVSLSFKVKSANIAALRAAVLSWDGTADAVTSDVVSAWAATPTFVANWTAENTPADLTVTSGWTTVTIEGILLDTANMNNLAVFIWTPNEETIGDIVYISQVKVNQGATASSFVPKSYEEELFACQRYCYVPPTPGTGSFVGFGMCISNALARIFVHFPNTMHRLPTLTATASDWQIDDSAAGTDVTAINNTDEATWNTTRMNNLRIGVAATPFTDKRPCSLKCDGTANRVMIFNAEL